MRRVSSKGKLSNRKLPTHLQWRKMTELYNQSPGPHQMMRARRRKGTLEQKQVGWPKYIPGYKNKLIHTYYSYANMLLSLTHGKTICVVRTRHYADPVP